MTTKGKRHTYKANDRIDELIDLRLNKGYSREELRQHLIKNHNLCENSAYVWVAKAAAEFETRAIVNFGKDLAEDIERFELLYSKAHKAGDLKECRDLLKEICKLKGHYVERRDITSKGEPITINYTVPE